MKHIWLMGMALTLALSGVGSAAHAPTFSDEVVRIVQGRCQTCHRPGEHAPFSLITYADVFKRRADIRDQIDWRTMPPWKPVPGFGSFLESRRLSDEERATILKWIDEGAPEGDPAKLPPPRAFPTGWTLGTPDHVLEMSAPYTVPARAGDVYRCFVVPTSFPEDRWVSKVEYAPGDKKVVHHVLAYIATGPTAASLQRPAGGAGYPCFGGPGFLPAGGLGGWAPGIGPRVQPDGVAWLLPAGATVVLQIHYNNGSPQAHPDRTRAALYFATSPVDKRHRAIPLLNRTFTIPAGEKRYEVRASYTVPPGRDLHATGITPHMHLLGREMKVTATYPDGTVRPLIYIDDWDFHWQANYTFEEPVSLAERDAHRHGRGVRQLRGEQAPAEPAPAGGELGGGHHRRDGPRLREHHRGRRAHRLAPALTGASRHDQRHSITRRAPRLRLGRRAVHFDDGDVQRFIEQRRTVA